MRLMRSNHAPHIDYGFLHSVDPNSPNFVPSDIDGVIERNGVFLFMEWKRPLEDMKVGQEKMLISLAKKPDVFVVRITGEQSESMTHIYGFEVIRNGNWVVEGESLIDFYGFYKRWLTYATNKK